MYPKTITPLIQFLDGDRIIKIFRLFTVDRDRRQMAQILTSMEQSLFDILLRRRKRKAGCLIHNRRRKYRRKSILSQDSKHLHIIISGIAEHFDDTSFILRSLGRRIQYLTDDFHTERCTVHLVFPDNNMAIRGCRIARIRNDHSTISGFFQKSDALILKCLRASWRKLRDRDLTGRRDLHFRFFRLSARTDLNMSSIMSSHRYSLY